MNLRRWIGPAVLAALCALSGVMKAVQSKEQLVGLYPWVPDVPATTVRFVGVLELLGAIGLVAPALSGVAPSLTPAAATGLAAMMVVATVRPAQRKQPRGVAVTAVLFVLAVLAVLVARERFGPHDW